jgi:hypothetical protein
MVVRVDKPRRQYAILDFKGERGSGFVPDYLLYFIVFYLQTAARSDVLGRQNGYSANTPFFHSAFLPACWLYALKAAAEPVMRPERLSAKSGHAAFSVFSKPKIRPNPAEKNDPLRF